MQCRPASFASALHGKISIPEAVFHEVTEKEDSTCRQILVSTDWIHVEQIKEENDRKMYKAKLHAGEVEVMILAQEAGVDVLTIIDDNAAKKTAKYLGLDVTGTMGVLLRAKKEGKIEAVKPVLEKLEKNGFYISDKVKQMVLEQAKEL